MVFDSETVVCQKFPEGTIEVPKESLSFRPSAYAVVLRDDKLLVVRNKYAPQKFALPGGAIKLGETPQETIIREVKEETGIVVEVKNFLSFNQVFYYYSPENKAYQGLFLYYYCAPQSLELRSGWRNGDDEGEAVWIQVSELSEGKLINGSIIISIIRQLYGYPSL